MRRKPEQVMHGSIGTAIPACQHVSLVFGVDSSTAHLHSGADQDQCPRSGVAFHVSRHQTFRGRGERSVTYCHSHNV